MIPLKVLNVVGSSRDLIKIAPIIRVMERSRQIQPLLVHTGQPHRDVVGFGILARDMDLPEVSIVLDVESGTHAKQTAAIMDRFEDTITDTDPDLVTVIGDFDSTVAASMTAVKRGVPVAHIDAGLRSFDRQDPKEINRVMTDSISDFLFVSEESAVDNLMCEGISPSKIHFVGSVLVDTLFENTDRIIGSTVVDRLGVSAGDYAVLVLRSQVSAQPPSYLRGIVEALEVIQRHVPVIFPLHLQTMAELRNLGLWESIHELPGVSILEPLPYIDFVALLKGAAMALTDTNGVQEETTSLQVPCLTFGERTERPVTVSNGSNRLIGSSRHSIVAEVMRVLKVGNERGGAPPMWDGQAAGRLVARLLDRREQVLELYRNTREGQRCRPPLNLAE